MKKTSLKIAGIAALFAAAFAFMSCGDSTKGTDPVEPVTPVDPEDPEDPVASDNLITKVTEIKGWNTDNNSNPEITGNLEKGYSVTYTQAANFQWGAQLLITTDAAVENGKYYKFSANVNVSADVEGVTVKLGASDDDNNTLFVENANKKFTAGDNTYEYYVKSANAIKASKVVFDFGYCAANTTVKVSDLKLVEITKDDMPSVTYKNYVLFSSTETVSEDASLNVSNPTYWWGTYTFNVVDNAISSTGDANACYGIPLTAAVAYKDNAKLVIKYTANNALAFKPVKPETEFAAEAGTDKTLSIDLGTAAELSTLGVVFKADSSTLTIKSVKIIDNE